MIIDFHTHIFPDNIAQKTVTFLAEEIDNLYPPVSDGTAAGLIGKMDEYGVDISVNAPVLTKPAQFKSTNDWCASAANKRIVSLGGLHPKTDDYKRDIDYISSIGLKGIKFHPEYQDFTVNAPEMLRIYDYALSKDLILLFHSGYDPAFKPPYRSSPAMFAEVYKQMKGGIIVAAHLGGCQMWDDTEQILPGTGVYIDTSMGFEFYSMEQFLRIVKKIGADKVLFGSDSPWSAAGGEIAAIKASGLPESDISAILGGNAARLLKII